MTTLAMSWFSRSAPQTASKTEAKPLRLLTDRALLLRSGRGDTDAFGELVRRYQKMVFNVAYRLMGTQSDAEDAAQEAFLRAFRALDRFEVDRPLAPWLKRITTNLCLNILQSAHERSSLSVVDVSRPGEDPVTMDKWQTPNPTPEQTVVAEQQADAVRSAILTLPPRYRAVIELRHFQGMRYDEIAETLERSVSNVKSDLFRARKLLAQKLHSTT